jgi:hypothetical protein
MPECNYSSRATQLPTVTERKNEGSHGYARYVGMQMGTAESEVGYVLCYERTHTYCSSDYTAPNDRTINELDRI